jgi:hypothetical protein
VGSKKEKIDKTRPEFQISSKYGNKKTTTRKKLEKNKDKNKKAVKKDLKNLTVAPLVRKEKN